MVNITDDVLDELFGEQKRDLGDLWSQRKTVASNPFLSLGPRVRIKDDDRVTSEVKQLNWTKVKNRSLTDMVGCIETPFLMMNERLHPTMSEKYFRCIRDTRKGRQKLLEKSGNESIKREMIVDFYLRDEFDADLIEITNKISLDEDLRSFLVRIDMDVIADYINNLPDKLVNGKIPKKVGDAIINALLDSEVFYGDEDDDDDVENFLEDLELGRLTQLRVLDKPSLFGTKVLENLALSGNLKTRTRVACLTGLSSDISDFLAEDENNTVLKKLVECTESCQVVKKVLENEKLTKTNKEIANLKFKDLMCDE